MEYLEELSAGDVGIHVNGLHETLYRLTTWVRGETKFVIFQPALPVAVYRLALSANVQS